LPQKLLVLAAPGAETESDAMAPCSAAIPAILSLSPLSPLSLESLALKLLTGRITTHTPSSSSPEEDNALFYLPTLVGCFTLGPRQ
jgi:hypothetical protein